jgi:hypothetical protein
MTVKGLFYLIIIVGYFILIKKITFYQNVCYECLFQCTYILVNNEIKYERIHSTVKQLNKC